MSGHTNIEFDPETQGAWQFGAFRLTWPRMGYIETGEPTFDQQRLHWAISGIQEMLSKQGFYPEEDWGDWVPSGVYGYETFLAVRRFQKEEMGLKARYRDGQVGRSEMEYLAVPRIAKMEQRYEIPGEVVAGMIYWESGWDPAAIGFLHPVDWGLGQFNMDVGNTFDQIGFSAFNARIAIEETAKRLGARYWAFLEETRDPDLALNCAVAAHNSPVDADAWAETGSPPDEQIATYVARIRNQYADGFPS